MPKIETFLTNSFDTVSILERLLNAVKNAMDGQTSIVNFYDYIDYSVKNSITHVIIENLEKERAKAYKDYYHLKKEALKELIKSKKILFEIISKHSLKSPDVSKIMEELSRFEKGGIIISGIYEHNLENYLFEICRNLSDLGHQEKIKQFVDHNRRLKNIYSNYIFSKSLLLFDKESESIEHLKKIEIWECWEKLKFIPEISRLAFGRVINSKVHLEEEESKYFLDFLIFREKVTSDRWEYENMLAQYKNYLTRLHNYFIQKIGESNTVPLVLSSNRLTYYPADGLVDYRGISSTFSVGKKGRELLNFLYTSKNSPLELKYFQAGCNDKIKVEKHRFKKEKDISDTISQIKRKLKVNKNEYFPIFKRENCFIWEEK